MTIEIGRLAILQTLFVDGTLTDPYVYATNVTGSGRIRLAQLNNMASFPADIDLIRLRNFFIGV